MKIIQYNRTRTYTNLIKGIIYEHLANDGHVRVEICKYDSDRPVADAVLFSFSYLGVCFGDLSMGTAMSSSILYECLAFPVLYLG